MDCSPTRDARKIWCWHGNYYKSRHRKINLLLPRLRSWQPISAQIVVPQWLSSRFCRRALLYVHPPGKEAYDEHQRIPNSTARSVDKPSTRSAQRLAYFTQKTGHLQPDAAKTPTQSLALSSECCLSRRRSHRFSHRHMVTTPEAEASNPHSRKSHLRITPTPAVSSFVDCPTPARHVV